MYLREETFCPTQHHDKSKERSIHEELVAPPGSAAPPRYPLLLVRVARHDRIPRATRTHSQEIP